jgi:hypothetical protein
MQSSVLGCTVSLEVPNQNQSLFLAEAILAALEAFLATSLDAPLLPYTPKLTIKILPTDFLSKPLEWEVSEERALIEIRHPKDGTDGRAMHDILPELIITIMTRLAVPADMAHFEKLFRDEQAMGRALGITNVGITIGNILGKEPKLRLDRRKRREIPTTQNRTLGDRTSNTAPKRSPSGVRDRRCARRTARHRETQTSRSQGNFTHRHPVME